MENIGIPPPFLFGNMFDVFVFQHKIADVEIPGTNLAKQNTTILYIDLMKHEICFEIQYYL